MAKSNNIYLDNYLYEEAIEKYFNKLIDKIKFDVMTISSKEALGYILAEPVFAEASSPNFTASAMDGIAVDFNKTLMASESNHVTLKKGEDYMVVDTGDYIEPKYNAVIMVENLIRIDDDTVKITSPIGFFENIRSTGEDIVNTQMILPSYHKIRPVDIGAIIAGGVSHIKVIKPFNVGIMPTGTEIVDVEKGEFEKGDIIDSNSYMLKALVEEMGYKACVNDIVEDDYDLLKQNIIKLTDENDIVLINAGSSAGREDFTKDILAELGEVVLHGVAIKPGKPVILAIVNNKMVVGIPGYPVATYIIFEKVIKPILEKLLNQKSNVNKIKAVLTKAIYSSLKHLEFVRMTLGYVNGKWIATPLARGAGVSLSLVESDGILAVPKDIEGYNRGEEVEIILSKNVSELENRLVSIGSHDLILDFVKTDFITSKSEFSVTSSHLGSFGGLFALKNKECIIAPIHILDENTGTYNIETVKQFFKDEKMVLIKGVKRQQGLIVQEGNPKGIERIEDVVNCKYVNRQASSGTYILLKYLLKEKNIESDDVIGFDFNVPTHFDVAVNIKDGVADCGLGIYSVAKSLGLDFVFVANEEYDFLLREEDLERADVKQFIKSLKSENVKQRIISTGGYEIDDIGEVVYID